MKKYYWPAIFVVFFVAAGLIVYFGFAPETKAPESKPLGENEASLVIDFGAKKRMFVGEVVANMTILDALEASSSGDSFQDLKYSFDYTTKTLAAIDDFANDGKKWNIYLNGVKEDGSLNEIVVGGGDEVELRLE